MSGPLTEHPSRAMARVGVMQGRLSPPVGDRIQAFPARHWRDEFASAQALGLSVMEWTLDHDGLTENPLMRSDGRREIGKLSARHGVRIPSLTGDCFMQRPFWKAAGAEREALVSVLCAAIEAGAMAGVRHFVVPLVDNGRLENRGQEDAFVAVIGELSPMLQERGAVIAVESDYVPAALAALMQRLPEETVGVNYDIGNSAALGFDSLAELAAYGSRIVNVHVKDRVRDGITVPLGTGAADLPRTIDQLECRGYGGHYVLQAARAADGDHMGAVRRYRDMLLGWLGTGSDGS